jgi:class 3 adenylate cyclase
MRFHYLMQVRLAAAAVCLVVHLFFANNAVAQNSQQYKDSLQVAFTASSQNKEVALSTAHVLVRTFLSENRPDLANVYLQKAFVLAKETGDRKMLGMSLYLQGKLHLSILDYDRAMTSFIEADKIFKIEGLRKEHGLAEMQFGILLYAQRNYKAASNYFNSAFVLLRESNDSLNFITTQYLHGLSLIELGDYKEAERVLKEALFMNVKSAFHQREMECRLGLAQLYLKVGKPLESLAETNIALDYYRTAEPEGTSNQTGKARAELLIGKAAIAIGNFKLAEQMLEQALLHEKLGNRYEECVQISEELIHVYDTIGDYKRAMSQVQFMLQLKDSLKKSDAEQTMRVLEDRQNIQLQNSKIELLTSQQENDRIIRLSLIVLTVLLLVLSVTWYQKFKLKKESGKKMDELLLNILPSEVAEELKAKGKATSKSYPSVTVMFVDIVAFTKMSERLSPDKLVADLHYFFSEFDEISARHRLEKIKTLGDAFMCAGGLPVENDTHAFDAVLAAREIINFIHHYNALKPLEEQIQVRIGIHTGPVIAGIVGIHKFAYDIWGDTVNIAARLEQAGEPGKINISESTYQRIRSSVECLSRGKINAKYKGEINMYYVS